MCRVSHFDIAKTKQTNVSKMFTAIMAFGINSGAYVAEIIRSGINSIDKGQSEAGRSLGFSYSQTMIYFILPQAIKNVLPALGNEFVVLLKETSVFSTISLMDLMFTAKDLIGMYAKTIECLFLLVVFYLIMLLPVSIIGAILERRLRYGQFGD